MGKEEKKFGAEALRQLRVPPVEQPALASHGVIKQWDVLC